MTTSITLYLATTAAQLADTAAARLGKPIALSIVDPGVHVILQHRGDGVHVAATIVSAAKARAAALFNRPSGRRGEAGNRAWQFMAGCPFTPGPPN